ncbi:transposase [Dactylosporangium vinaceum]|nr:transposase [Dactylosporangium vinaceum]
MLPAQPTRGGRWRDHRQVINASCWVKRTGSPWRDLPERHGPGKTPYQRFRRWAADGTWALLKQQVVALAEADGDIDWDAQVDSTVVRVHQHAASAHQGGSTPTYRRHGRASDGPVVGEGPHPVRRARPAPCHPDHTGPGRRHPPARAAAGAGVGDEPARRGRPRKRPDSFVERGFNRREHWRGLATRYDCWAAITKPRSTWSKCSTGSRPYATNHDPRDRT